MRSYQRDRSECLPTRAGKRSFSRLFIEFIFEFARFCRQLDTQFLQGTRKISEFAIACAVRRRLCNSAKIFDNNLDHPAKPQLAPEPRMVRLKCAAGFVLSFPV